MGSKKEGEDENRGLSSKVKQIWNNCSAIVGPKIMGEQIIKMGHFLGPRKVKSVNI